MVLIQSTPSGLAVPGALLLVLCVAGLVVGAAGSALARRLSNPVGKYRLLYALVVGPLALGSYGLLALLDFGLAVRAAFLPWVGGFAGTVFAEFVTFLAGGVVGLAAYAPTVRGVRAARDVPLSTTTALAQMTRYVVAFAVLFALFVPAFRLGLGGPRGSVGSQLGLVAGFVVLGVIVVVGSPWVVTAMRSTRRPTDAEADRLDALRERAGLSVRDARVFETDGAETASALVRGAASHRRLFVTDAFFDAYDDDTATALLAVQAGRTRSRVIARRLGAVLASAAALLFALSPGPLWPLVGAAVVVLLAGLWVARRGVAAADDYAAERVGADAVVAAFERYAEFHAMEPSRRRVPNPLSATVPLGDRIDRVRGHDTEGAGDGRVPTD
ncbi:hypothetical protein [Candidatus Halobonum tyrrellensis]|uniref:Putative peptidase n=1 Tax=Candidatus Halobonum tyrrellensis G22 TaxID=1324957 RepID=V4HB33_9EURY|nr:hypothetical protein [Candidatus Halobonum tyrrellensis]ESP87900.1 putative peptidase [Candidatus Halobonum tyrrellensis G22]